MKALAAGSRVALVAPSGTLPNKTQIKQAIEKLFKKTVVAVNTCNYAGKKKRERTAAFGRQADWKKAIVTLKKGDKIELA